MDLAWRIAQVIIPVFLIVAVGYAYGRRARISWAIFMVSVTLGLGADRSLAIAPHAAA
jgi:hypothetical protein